MILSIAVDGEGHCVVCYQLYDCNGEVAAASAGTSPFPEGLRINSAGGELLLDLPAEHDASMQYRLYNNRGELLTSSDGKATSIGPCLRMETPNRGPAAYRAPQQHPQNPISA